MLKDYVLIWSIIVIVIQFYVNYKQKRIKSKATLISRVCKDALIRLKKENLKLRQQNEALRLMKVKQ